MSIRVYREVPTDPEKARVGKLYNEGPMRWDPKHKVPIGWSNGTLSPYDPYLRVAEDQSNAPKGTIAFEGYDGMVLGTDRVWDKWNESTAHYAKVFDPHTFAVRSVYTHGDYGYVIREATVEKDIKPEYAKIIGNIKKRKAIRRAIKDAFALRTKIRWGDLIESTTTRGKKVGVRGRVFKFGDGQYGPYIGVKDMEGNATFLTASRTRRVEEDLPTIEAIREIVSRLVRENEDLFSDDSAWWLDREIAKLDEKKHQWFKENIHQPSLEHWKSKQRVAS